MISDEMSLELIRLVPWLLQELVFNCDTDVDSTIVRSYHVQAYATFVSKNGMKLILSSKICVIRPAGCNSGKSNKGRQ
jgi:hypothetical protein